MTVVTLTGTVKDADQNVAVGTVSFRLSAILRNTSGAIVATRAPITATLNASGQFSVSLYATNDPTLMESGAYYTMTYNVVGMRNERFEFELDYTDTTQDLSSITARTDTSDTATATYALATDAIPQGPSAIPLAQTELAAVMTAMGTIRTTGLDVVCITDSIGVLGDDIDQTWPKRVEEMFGALHHPQLLSDGLMYGNTNGGAYPHVDTPGGSYSTTGFADYSSLLSNGQVMAHTPTNPCDAVTVVYTKDPSYGTVAVAQGGTARGTVTGTGTAASSNIVTITGVAGAGQWTFTSTGANLIEAVYFHGGNVTAGPRFWTAGHAGYTSADIVDSTSTATFITNLSPDVVVIGTGTNDDTANISARITALVAAVRAACSTATVVLAIPFIGGTIPYADIAVVRGLASTLGCGVIDFATVLGDVSSANDPYELSSDGTHPSASGFSAMAMVAAAVLSGDPIGTLLRLFVVGPQYVRRFGWLGYSTNGSCVGTLSTLGYQVIAGFATKALAAAGTPSWYMVDNGLATGLGLPGPGLYINSDGTSTLANYVAKTADGTWSMGTAELIAKDFAPSSTTGATQAFQYFRGTATVAPITGTWSVGAICPSVNGKLWMCTVQGTPGTWVEVGSASWQPLDADLTAIAALTSAADKMPYSTGAQTWALTDLSSFARTILDDANAAAVRTTIGLVAIAASGSASDLSTGTVPAAQMPALTGDVTTSAGAVATTIAANAVTNAKAAQVATKTIKGRTTASTGNVEDLTAAQAQAIIDSVIGAATRNFDGVAQCSTVTWTANRSSYTRIIATIGAAITAVDLIVSTASGNVDVGVYPASGAGVSAVPGAKRATAGATACPASAAVTIALACTPIIGDFFGFAADNGTIVVRGSGITATAANGMNYYDSTDYALPSTPTTISSCVGGPILTAA